MSLERRTFPFNGVNREEPHPHHQVLGGGHVGDAIADRLRADGHIVARVDETTVTTDERSVRGDPATLPTLSSADLGDADAVVVATGSDARNLLVAQQVRAHFDVERVLVLTHHPERVTSIAAAGHEPVCVTTVIADGVARHV
ncbi:NAD-binding protein [Halorubellus salinus]|uniref:NAD-binding protein n=1 Tax=Halorubellus salinus TaxID=755309 RepID=UPI001D08A36B|nr:NAD-binding protein [Halorubellus salinus]